MIRLKKVAILKATNEAKVLEMSLLDLDMVLLTVVFSSSGKVIWGVACWNDLWSCLFLPRGEHKDIDLSALTKIRHPKGKGSKHLKLTFVPVKKKKKIKVAWKDFREALLTIRKT